MFTLAVVMLAGGVKGFFEDPAYLIGIPLLALGVIGMLIVLSPIRDARPSQTETEVAPEAGGEVSAGRAKGRQES